MSVVSVFLSYIFLFFIVSLPITIWAYVFSYVGGVNIAQKGLFQRGIFAGILALVPFLFLEKIYNILSLPFLNIFHSFSLLGISFLSFFSFLLALLFLTLFLFSFSYLSSFFQKSYTYPCFSLQQYIPYVYVIGFIFFLSVALVYLKKHLPFSFLGGEQIKVAGVYFSGFFGLSGYYLMTAFGEEISKYFHFSQISEKKKSRREDIYLLAIFVALGFVFLENFLYVFSVYKSSLDSVFGVVLFRSLFSLMLHVLCTTLFLQSFYRKEVDTNKIYFAYLAITLHAIFNIALSYNFILLIFIFFVGGYFYVSKKLIDATDIKNLEYLES